MLSDRIPKFLEVEVKYSYLEDSIIYVFPRLRKLDAELDEKERLLGQGKKLKSSERLSFLVENIYGFPGFEQRGENEPKAEFQKRVMLYFANEEGEEFAEDAIICRLNSVYPHSFHRGRANYRMEVDLPRTGTGETTVLPLRDLSQAGKGPEDRMSAVPIDPGGRSA